MSASTKRHIRTLRPLADLTIPIINLLRRRTGVRLLCALSYTPVFQPSSGFPGVRVVPDQGVHSGYPWCCHYEVTGGDYVGLSLG
jgi:hypothetical protein